MIAPPGLAQDDEMIRLRWRVLVAVPPGGFGAQLPIMHAWLDQSCGSAGWAADIGGVREGAAAFYFTDRAAARRFVERFSCGYAPHAESRYNRSVASL